MDSDLNMRPNPVEAPIALPALASILAGQRQAVPDACGSHCDGPGGGSASPRRPGQSGHGISTEIESPGTVNANYACTPHQCLLVDVLMTVEKQTRLHTFDVSVEGFKSKVDIIIPVVNTTWGVVRDEYIHRREGRHLVLDFILLVKEMSSRLIPP